MDVQPHCYSREEDVARAMEILASPAAGFFTGTNIPVDGGMAAA